MDPSSAEPALSGSSPVPHDWWRSHWPYLAPTALLLFVLPLAHTTALRMIFLALSAIAAAWFWRQGRALRPPLIFPFLICTLIALASLITAADPAFSFDEIKKELGYGLIVFLAFYSLSRTGREISVWMLVLLGDLVLLGTYTLWQGLSKDTLAFDGWHGGVLNYSVFVATVFPLLLCAVVYPGLAKRWRMTALLLIPLALLTGYFTENRTFWCAIVASTMIFSGMFLKLSGVKAAWKPVLLGALLIVSVSVLAFYSTAKQRIGAQSGVAETFNSTAEKDPRGQLWAYGIQRIREQPWTGTGFGRMAQARQFGVHFNNEPLWVHAHNLFLDYGIQMGIPGILAFVYLFLCVIREFFRLYRFPDLRVALIGIAGTAIVAAVVLKSATDDQFVRHNALLFWALVAMGLGYGARLAQAITARPSTMDASTNFPRT